MVPLGLPEADASGPGFLSGAREPKYRAEYQPRRAHRASTSRRHVDQCNGRLNTASSQRDTLAPHNVQQCKLPSTLAAHNLDALLSVRSLPDLEKKHGVSVKTRNSSLAAPCSVCRLSSFEDKLMGSCGAWRRQTRDHNSYHRLTWPEIETASLGNDLVSSRPSGLLIIFRGSRL